jgi:hypothetical protein
VFEEERKENDVGEIPFVVNTLVCSFFSTPVLSFSFFVFSDLRFIISSFYLSYKSSRLVSFPSS